MLLYSFKSYVILPTAILLGNQFRICFNWPWWVCSLNNGSSSVIRFIFSSSFWTLSTKFLNLLSNLFWENSKLSFRSFISLLRLSRRWFVNELFPDINARIDCETFLDSVERLTLRLSLASFQKLLYCPSLLNFWSLFQNCLWIQFECLCHSLFFLLYFYIIVHYISYSIYQLHFPELCPIHKQQKILENCLHLVKTALAFYLIF